MKHTVAKERKLAKQWLMKLADMLNPEIIKN